MSEASIEELKKAIAAIFLGEGTDKMGEEQMLTAISMKRRWFSPESAKMMIENGKRHGLLRENGKFLSPAFDYREIEIPFGYFPPESVTEIQEESVMDRMIREMGLSQDDVEEALSMDYNLLDCVKILLWVAMYGKEYEKFIDNIEKEIV